MTQLTQGLARGDNLTLVVAPAGFGKTTLVSQWIDTLSLTDEHAPQGSSAAENNAHPPKIDHVAWLSLDEYDNDLGLFLGYIVAALQCVFPAACPNTVGLLQGLRLPPVHYLATTLLSELAELPNDFILVLDDYHTIEETTIHQLVARLLDHLPRQSHLVLISRTEPPLPLARQRVRQRTTELRAAGLYFSRDEAQTFLRQALDKPPAPETITALHTQTEGWIAGLQLAALALRGQNDERSFVRSFVENNNRHVMDYLMEEVLMRQPLAVQEFLVRTSILDRFCIPLCEALLGGGSKRARTPSSFLHHDPADHQTILEYLVQANLFVVALNDQGDWYRYHHLFQALLRHHLQAHATPTEIALLRSQASAWLANHGWIEEAVQQALAAGDHLTAAELVEQHRHELLNREDWRTLDRWLALLPAAQVRQRPGLLLAQAFILGLQYKFTAITPLLQTAAARLAEENLTDAQLIQGEIDALWSQSWYWQNEGQQSLTAAQQALEQLPTTHLYVRSGALLYLGVAYHMVGQSTLAIKHLRAALEPHTAQANTLTTRVLFTLTTIHYLAGALTHLHETAQDFWQMATQANLSLSTVWGHYFLGVVYYEWNDLEAAAHHFSAVVDLRYSGHALAVHNGWLGLAWTAQAQGRNAEAQQQVAALLHFHREMNHLAFLPITHAFQARLALQQGDGASALRWAQAAHLGPVRGPLLFPELPQLTLAKILLSQATAESVAEATLLLAQLQQIAENTHNTVRRIELLALQALAAASQGQTEQALTTLQRAVLLAKPGRFIRTFVDLGP
ncbi:MAG: hypothetical protein NT075_15295, partial [Chloroflexi bacterium]|nr:hypothetical protein [Chloroflexota bacterium]